MKKSPKATPARHKRKPAPRLWEEELIPAEAASIPVDDAPGADLDMFLRLAALTDHFCQTYLNDEYQELCRKIDLLLSEDGSPAREGRAKLEGWAAGVVSSVGWVNFLGDPSQVPHMRSEDIAKGFGVSLATMQARSKAIRDGLDLIPLDPRYTLPSKLDDNPLVWMLSVNGLMMDIRHAPRGAQVAAFEAGLIPYIPADRKRS